MATPPKDPVRAQLMKDYPAAPPGYKKHFDTATRNAGWVRKTQKELLREAKPKAK